MNRPLWEMYVIEGLDNVEGVPKGSFGILSKVHHASMDGASGMEMTTAIHDLEADATPPAPTQEWRPEREPTPFELMSRAAANNAMRPMRLAATMSRVFGNSQDATRRALQAQTELPPPVLVPPTIFNGKVSPHRVVEGRRFDLAEIKRIKSSVPGATVNDVMLTIVGGALRKYLDAHDALPPDPLIAMCPISLRSKDEQATGGNQVGAMTVSLGTNIANPALRLQTVHRSTTQSKLAQEGVDARQLTELTQHMPGALMGLAARLTSDLGLSTTANPPYNTVVTNVPGPQFPLYSCGARLVTMFSFGMVHDGMGLMNVVSSYCGEVTVTFTADRDMLPDPLFYAECIQSSYEDLAKATT
jgi:WS/DGAT/MGAT family acyltransferase